MEKNWLLIRKIPFSRSGVAIAVAIVSIIGAAGVGWIIPTTFAPLMIAAGILGAGVLVLWFKKPIIAFYTAVWLVFLPLGLVPAEIQSFLNRFTAVAAFITWALMVVLRRQRILLTPALLIMSAFLIWGLTSLLWSFAPSQTISLVQIYTLRWIVFLLLSANFLTSQKNLDGFMQVLAINGWILMAAFVFALLSSGKLPGSRLKIFGMNENEAAALALIFIPGILWKNITKTDKKTSLSRWQSLIYVMLASLLTVMSGSRGSAISLVIMMLGFLIIPQTRIYPLLSLSVAVILAFIYPQIFSTILYRFTLESRESLLGGREAIWKAASMMISAHPWLGVGLGNAPTEIIRYLRLFSPVYSDSVALHNPLLTIWAETGLIGLLLYGSVLASSIVTFLKQCYIAKLQQQSAILTAYGIIGITVAAYLVSWIKGGGAESEFAFFLTLTLLNVPLIFPTRSDHLNREYSIL